MQPDRINNERDARTPDAARRLRGMLWAIAQTALAAGLAWYITRDVLGHVTPFFAPIAAAVCLWTTNVVRAELAVELVIGVAIGIGVGTGVHATLGTGPMAMAVAVLLSLSAAVVVGRDFLTHRPMFVNQTVISAILILAFPRSGFGPERLYDALIGGGLAVIFSILIFPKNPLAVLRDARRDVLTTLRDILIQTRCRTDDSSTPDPSWTLVAAARLHRRLARLTEARSTAKQLARFCPRRWPLRSATRTADRQAAQLALLANSVLHLARTITTTVSPVAKPLRAAIDGLAVAGVAFADDEQAAAVRRYTAAFNPATPTTTQVLLAAVVDTCANELQQLLDLAPR